MVNIQNNCELIHTCIMQAVTGWTCVSDFISNCQRTRRLHV